MMEVMMARTPQRAAEAGKKRAPKLPDLGRTPPQRVGRARALRRAMLRRGVLLHERIDVLATQVAGYEVRPFHLDLLRFQAATRKSLQLAPRGFAKSTVLNIMRCLYEVIR